MGNPENPKINPQTLYFDNAATTPVKDSVYRKIVENLSNYINPSSIYVKGLENAILIKNVRKTVADFLKCNLNQIFFTSCASESNNWAIKETVKKIRKLNPSKNLILVNPIEHKSVLNSCKSLVNEGFEVKYFSVNEYGQIDLDQVTKIVTQYANKLALVTIMTVNNELGTIYPIYEVAKICKLNNVNFHTDATQAIDIVNFNLTDNPGITSLSFTGHKIGCPKGIGVLYLKDPDINNLIDGGQQEFGKRSGTENLPYILGLGEAIKSIQNPLSNYTDLQYTLNWIKDLILFMIPDSYIINNLNSNDIFTNDFSSYSSPKLLSVGFTNINGEVLALRLSEKGIFVSNGSACNTKSLEPSYVLKEVGVPQEYINGVLRISPPIKTTYEQCKYFVEQLSLEILKMRNE